MQVDVLIVEDEKAKAEAGNYWDKLEAHSKDHVNMISISGATKKLLNVGNGEEMDVDIYVPKDINAGTLSVEIAPVKRVEHPRQKKELEFDDLSEVLHDVYDEQIFTPGQYWYMNFNE